MPPDAVYVGRPSRWGNPFREEDSRAEAIDYFREWVLRLLATDPEYLEPLRGKTLVCWCPLDQPCHADVLMELAATP